jgi:hypothetical protein
MFKLSATILLLAAFAVQTFYKTFIVTDYYTNTSAYAKNCENKAKPQLHCNGKCQMMKKLKQEEKKDQQNPERKADNKDEVISSKSFFASVNQIALVSKIHYNFFNNNSVQDRTSDFFHPPTL